MQENRTNWDGVGQANKKKAQTIWTGTSITWWSTHNKMYLETDYIRLDFLITN
jgi:hypothetical protein